MTLPNIIQGGMGVYISTPFLVRQISLNRGLGTSSGTLAWTVMARILQNGDPSGHYRRALAHFPFPEVAEKIVDTYYVPNGIPKGTSYKSIPVFNFTPSDLLIDLTVCANFAFVWLAKEGHTNPVSINYLEKVNRPHIYSLVGSMLAGVDVITMGAGIPLQVPKILDAIASGEPAKYRIMVEGDDDPFIMEFDPKKHFGSTLPEMKRPAFLPVVSTDVLAKLLLQKVVRGGSTIEGFVVETSVAGGHNAPPRDKSETYGAKDEVDWSVMKKLGLPFWIGGSFASPKGLAEAIALGATGIQVGSIFALSEESGLDTELKREARRLAFSGQLQVKTDFRVSPTGFPFKVAVLDGTLSDEQIFLIHERTCSQGSLSTPYKRADGTVGFRCPAENVNQYKSKGGDVEDTGDRTCLCNALLSAASLGDPGGSAIVTLGDDLSFLRHLIHDENGSYRVAQAMKYLLGG
jgi:NAD(P)H-dependent flavin oxidoreductase YrpB (nitropropane dioxygenase family)